MRVAAKSGAVRLSIVPSSMNPIMQFATAIMPARAPFSLSKKHRMPPESSHHSVPFASQVSTLLPIPRPKDNAPLISAVEIPPVNEELNRVISNAMAERKGGAKDGEASAKTGDGVVEIFKVVADKLPEPKQEEEKRSFPILPEPQTPSKSSCC